MLIIVNLVVHRGNLVMKNVFVEMGIMKVMMGSVKVYINLLKIDCNSEIGHLIEICQYENSIDGIWTWGE